MANKGQWKEVVRLTFKGERFHDHALDLYALSELSQFQKIVLETAKALWRSANPDRTRLPRHFEDRTRLCLRRVEEGSAVAPLEVFIEEPGERQLWEEPREVEEAIGVAHDVFIAAHDDKPLPENLPKELVPEYARWAQGLGESESIELASLNRQSVSVTSRVVKELEKYREPLHATHVDICGEVLAADVHMRRCKLWLDDRTHVTVVFSAEQEDDVTRALHNHRSVRLHVRGVGEEDSKGRLHSVSDVQRLDIEPTEEEAKPSSGRSIEAEIAELAAGVPDSEWQKLPEDLGKNLDRYIYGGSEGEGE